MQSRTQKTLQYAGWSLLTCIKLACAIALFLFVRDSLGIFTAILVSVAVFILIASFSVMRLFTLGLEENSQQSIKLFRGFILARIVAIFILAIVFLINRHYWLSAIFIIWAGIWLIPLRKWNELTSTQQDRTEN